MSELIDCIDGLTAEGITMSIAKTVNGVPFYLQVLRGGFTATCAEYQAIYDAFTTKPSDDIATAQDTMVCGLVSDGVWAKLDAFYMFAQTINSANEALINWVDPGTNNATLINVPTFTSLEGFTNAGTTGINTNFNFAVDGVNFQQDNASYGVYIRQHSVDGFPFGARDTITPLYDFIRLLNASNITQFGVNGSANNKTYISLQALYGCDRTNATQHNIYINGGAPSVYSRVSTGVPSLDAYVLCSNDNGAPTLWFQGQVSMVWIGGYLGAALQTAMSDRFETYMDSNMKGIIP